MTARKRKQTKEKPNKTKYDEISILESLRKMIINNGVTDMQYGGFHIVVNDNKKFPWYDVLNLLIDSGQNIWIEEDKDKHIVIMSKTKVH
ncbi:MAG TPA: hypothetical protein VJH34_01905 [archaeon]|nr:hypothetical protein [archaeon]